MNERILAVNQWVIGVFYGVQEYFTLGGRALRFAFSRPFYFRDLLRQMDQIGVGSLPPLILTGMFTGMVLALQTAVQLQLIGAESLLGNLVGEALIREAAPVLSALMIAGRVASGIAAELGAMRVSEQIDALQTFGTDPIRKLVTPRILAGMIMVPVLTIITVAIGAFGGLIVAVLKGVVAPDVYVNGVISALARKDFIFGFFPLILLLVIVKPLVFGLIITLSGAYYGLEASGGGEGVGRATTRAMVLSFVLILVSDFFLTFVLSTLFNLIRYGGLKHPGNASAGA